MVTGTKSIDGVTYTFSSTGIMTYSSANDSSTTSNTYFANDPKPVEPAMKGHPVIAFSFSFPTVLSHLSVKGYKHTAETGVRGSNFNLNQLIVCMS